VFRGHFFQTINLDGLEPTISSRAAIALKTLSVESLLRSIFEAEAGRRRRFDFFRFLAISYLFR
jgi:hypothetical protein